VCTSRHARFDGRIGSAFWRHATTRPASHHGARPPVGGRTDSVSGPPRAISHEITEFEFHISPAFVATPNGRQHVRHQVEHALGWFWIVRQSPRALDRLADVWDDTVLPPTHLVAEDPEAPAQRLPTAPSATTPRGARCREGPVSSRPRNDPPARAPRVRSDAGPLGPPLEPCRRRLIDASVQPHRMTARAQREPVEIDARSHFTSHI
jgi:hypothetical protein